jgi:hypothetical protein
MVVPGRYAVRLAVGRHSQTHRFEILPDPRIAAGPRELAAQFALLHAIVSRLTAVNTTVNEIDAVREQMATLERRQVNGGWPAPLRKSSGEVRRELAALRGALIDTNYSQAQLWPSGLHEKFNALFDTVDSADRAPARQMYEVFEALSRQLEAQLARWRMAQRKLLPSLNRSIAAARLPLIGWSFAKGGEKDVYAAQVAALQAGLSD